jgi:hypothetical protein
MSLADTLQAALTRFRPNHPHAPATTFVYGFIMPDAPPCAISIGRAHADFVPHVRDADHLIYGTSAQIAALFDPDHVGRARIVAQLDMRPRYPFNHYLLSILLAGLDLAIPDLSFAAERFDGPYPFPPIYPTAENRYRTHTYTPTPLPTYDPAHLPALIADDHPTWVAMYDFAWQTAFKNLRQPEAASGFIANFIDAAFNPNAFMWDSCFMMMFGRYGRRIFPFMGTLDNFYAKQHDDGFICREINTYSGAGVFQSLDPRSTGPNLLAWTEWTHFQTSGDLARLHAVFPALIAYHRWWKTWRTHPDGSYWTSGWGSGMDNQTRIPNSEYHHRGYAWIDANFQQVLSCESLLAIGARIGCDEFDGELLAEHTHLTRFINAYMWDEKRGFYADRAPDGMLSAAKTIGAYWGLLSDAVPRARAARMIAHLDDPITFKRPHRVPTQSADSPDYNPYGGYWLGGVWSPTNYMVLRGLTRCSANDLAHAIAREHLDQVAAVFASTGTLWENYAPEYTQPGKPAGRDFVGWTGVSAIAIPLEYGIGVRPSDDSAILSWDIRLTERHGVLRYPFGAAQTVDLVCEARTNTDIAPTFSVRTDAPLMLDVQWGARTQRFALETGEHRLRFALA